jgi:hypothetical protein
VLGPTFDATATRAATGAQIRSVASPDICFDVSNFRAGDFRFNLIPVALKKCDTSVAGQKFDLITKVNLYTYSSSPNLSNILLSRVCTIMWQMVAGLSSSPVNNSPASIEEVTSTIVLVLAFSLVVSLFTIHVHRLFIVPIGGRAAGDGETTADQQYFFNATSNLSNGIGFPLARDAQNNGIGAGNQCLTLNRDGFLSNTPCSPPNFTPEQSWVVGDVVGASSPGATSTIPTSPTTLAASTPVASASSTTPPAPPSATPPAPTSTTAPETFVLPPPGDGPGKSASFARRD